MNDKNSKRIAVLICFFGNLPWYFNYFVHSCKYNPTIDFYIITDDRNWLNKLPVNVKVIYKNMKDFNQMATQKLGFATNIRKGYKTL